MQLARTSVIIKPISDVAVLLNLDQRDSCADRVDCPGRKVEKVSGPHFVPCQQLLDRAVDGRRPELPRVKRTIETDRSEEHTYELQSLMRISYAVFCLKKKNNNQIIPHKTINQSDNE